MRVRAFIFSFPGTAIDEGQAVEAGAFPIEITLQEAVEWYWRYREIDVETLFLGTSSSGTAPDADADAAAAGERERHLIYPADGRDFTIDLDASAQTVDLTYFHPVALISPPDPPPYYESFRWKPSTAIQPSFVLNWQASYASIDGKADVYLNLTSVIDSQDPLDFGYTTFNATVFGETIPMAGIATYNAGANALSIAGCTLDIVASRWFEYKKDDASLPVWEETSGVEILDPLTASVP